jgi:dethiobiotin synthetase
MSVLPIQPSLTLPQLPSATPHGWFITGTDTGVGKTLTSSALLEALHQRGQHAIGMKPVASGTELGSHGAWINDDVEQLYAASVIDAPLGERCPYLFRQAIAPHLAATAEGRTIEASIILKSYAALRLRAQCVVVEGVGGFRVPLAPGFDTADLAKQLALPVVLVVGMRLGCINHALLTIEAIQARGLELAGWIASSIDPDMLAATANLDTLRGLIDAPLIGHIPYITEIDSTQRRLAAARHLNLGHLLGEVCEPTRHIAPQPMSSTH